MVDLDFMDNPISLLGITCVVCGLLVELVAFAGMAYYPVRRALPNSPLQLQSMGCAAFYLGMVIMVIGKLLTRWFARSVYYDHSEIFFATESLRVMPIIVVVSLVSYVAKSRMALVAGILGSFLGYVVPEPSVWLYYADVPSLLSTANHILFYGVVGAVLGCSLVIRLRSIRRSSLRFSIQTLLWLTAACAVAVGFHRWFG